MGDWNIDVRRKSTTNLTAFLKYTEDQITGYTNIILSAAYKILAGDDAQIMKAVCFFNIWQIIYLRL